MIFLLAAVLAVVGVVLLYLDTQKRRGHRQLEAPQPPQSIEQHPQTEPADSFEEDDFEPEPEPEPEPLTPRKPAVVREPEPVPDFSDSTMVIDQLPDDEQFDLDEEHDEEIIKETDEENPELRVSFRSLPGRVRRERRAWALRQEYQYLKTDESLVGEFRRGQAGTGLTPRDVVSGLAAGYEMHLFDIGQVTVMAMRRKASSDIIFEAYRLGDKTLVPDDLIAVQRLAGFQLYGTDQAAVQRFIDDRVAHALSQLPAAVTTVWAEGEWLLAQTPKIEGHHTWEAMVDPLAQLADAAYVLPPLQQAVQPLEFHDCDPTRPMPANPIPVDDVEEDAGPPVLPVLEPEAEPVSLPKRARVEARGVVEKHEVGADEVDPIASGKTPQKKNFYGPRVIRDTSMGSLIFNDSSEEGLESR